MKDVQFHALDDSDLVDRLSAIVETAGEPAPRAIVKPVPSPPNRPWRSRLATLVPVVALSGAVVIAGTLSFARMHPQSTPKPGHGIRIVAGSATPPVSPGTPPSSSLAKPTAAAKASPPATGTSPRSTPPATPAADACHTGLPAGSGCSIAAWGENSEGFVGDGTTAPRPAPVAMMFPAGTRIKQVAASDVSSEVLLADGSVWSAGQNQEGELGSGTYFASSASPVRSLTGVASIGRGGQYTEYAVRSDGSAWAWGAGGHGELGNGTTGTSASPVQVSGLANVVQIAGEENGAVALKSDGTVWAWGINDHGELGSGSTCGSVDCIGSLVPRQVQGLNGIVSISTGYDFALALRSDGTVWAWGAGNGGQTGTGYSDALTPNEIDGPGGAPLQQVVSIAAGGGTGYALRSDGSLVSWGWNQEGEAGNGAAYNNAAPPAVVLTGVSSIAAGREAAAAIKTDGTLWTWGGNGSGGLGIGSAAPYVDVPTQMKLPGFCVDVAEGFGDGLALIR